MSSKLSLRYIKMPPKLPPKAEPAPKAIKRKSRTSNNDSDGFEKFKEQFLDWTPDEMNELLRDSEVYISFGTIKITIANCSSSSRVLLASSEREQKKKLRRL